MFVAATGLQTPVLLWDQDFGSWDHYGVTGQPTAVLVDASGTPVHTFDGLFDANEVLQKVAELF